MSHRKTEKKKIDNLLMGVEEVAGEEPNHTAVWESLVIYISFNSIW
jgi:hypothetical protein